MRVAAPVGMRSTGNPTPGQSRPAAPRPSRTTACPLSDSALAALERMEKLHDEGEELVFPGVEKRRVLSDVALSKIAKLCSPGTEITLHGFRSPFRDWAGEASAYRAHRIPTRHQNRFPDPRGQSRRKGARPGRQAEPIGWPHRSRPHSTINDILQFCSFCLGSIRSRTPSRRTATCQAVAVTCSRTRA